LYIWEILMGYNPTQLPASRLKEFDVSELTPQKLAAAGEPYRHLLEGGEASLASRAVCKVASVGDFQRFGQSVSDMRGRMLGGATWYFFAGLHDTSRQQPASNILTVPLQYHTSKAVKNPDDPKHRQLVLGGLDMDTLGMLVAQVHDVVTSDCHTPGRLAEDINQAVSYPGSVGTITGAAAIHFACEFLTNGQESFTHRKILLPLHV
jgi:hypothetical protein